MAVVTYFVIAGVLAALGIILVFSFITKSYLKEKLRESYQDKWKAFIKKRYYSHEVPVIEVDVYDLFGNSIGTDKFASLDGIEPSLTQGYELQNNE